jgi:hypothetical protein
MADFDDDQLVPFEIDHISLEFFGDHQAVRDLAREESAPEVPHVLWRDWDVLQPAPPSSNNANTIWGLQALLISRPDPELDPGSPVWSPGY